MSSRVTAILLAALSRATTDEGVHTAYIVVWAAKPCCQYTTLFLANHFIDTHSSSRHHLGLTVPVSTGRKDEDRTEATHRLAKSTPHLPVQFAQTTVQHIDLTQKAWSKRATDGRVSTKVAVKWNSRCATA